MMCLLGLKAVAEVVFAKRGVCVFTLVALSALGLLSANALADDACTDMFWPASAVEYEYAVQCGQVIEDAEGHLAYGFYDVVNAGSLVGEASIGGGQHGGWKLSYASPAGFVGQEIIEYRMTHYASGCISPVFEKRYYVNCHPEYLPSVDTLAAGSMECAGVGWTAADDTHTAIRCSVNADHVYDHDLAYEVSEQPSVGVVYENRIEAFPADPDLVGNDSQPEHYWYVPQQDYVGEDSFEVLVRDRVNQSSVVETMWVTVEPPMSLPDEDESPWSTFVATQTLFQVSVRRC